MAEVEAKLDILDKNVRQLNQAFNILFFLLTTDERGQTLFESLKKVDVMVKDLNDKHLTALYDNLFTVFLSGVPHQQVIPDDYMSFLKRLWALVNEATSQANAANISLREATGLKSVIDVWGRKSWHPSW